MPEAAKSYSCVEPLSKEHEIVLKQVYAWAFKAWGYDIPLSVKEIGDPKNFTHSKAKIDTSSNPPEVTVSENTSKIYSQARRNLHFLDATDDDSSSQETLDEKKSRKSLQKAVANKDNLHAHLQHFNPEDLHTAFFKILRNDGPDLNLLHFVVARKWNAVDALNMVARCLDWRVNSHPVDDWVFAGDAEVYWGGKHPKMIQAYELNQVYLRGHDKEGRPIVVVHVQKHLRKNCPDEEFERFICIFIEWIRLELKSHQTGVTKGCLLFDMTGFGMKNADLAAVHFLATMFEANYPESLGMIWIHNAPWIFNAVWKVIKGWLDPVVASKVRFTKGVKDLKEFIDPKYIPKDLGGDDTYNNEFIVPTKENAGKLPKDDKFKALVKERDNLTLVFLEATQKWILAKTPEESLAFEKIRTKVQIDLAKNYIEIDPYVRTRAYIERSGEMGPIGY